MSPRHANKLVRWRPQQEAVRVAGGVPCDEQRQRSTARVGVQQALEKLLHGHHCTALLACREGPREPRWPIELLRQGLGGGQRECGAGHVQYAMSGALAMWPCHSATHMATHVCRRACEPPHSPPAHLAR